MIPPKPKGFSPGWEKKRMERADYAPTSVRLYYEAYVDYAAWCMEHQHPPVSGDPGIVADYLKHLSKTNAISTVRLARAAIATLHTTRKCPLDVRDPRIRVACGLQPRREAITRWRKTA